MTDVSTVLWSDDPDDVVRLFSRVEDIVAARDALAEALKSDDRQRRFNSALGLYAMATEPPESQNNVIARDLFERLLAAVAVESDSKVKSEMFIALVAYEYDTDLSIFAPLVARLIEHVALTSTPVSEAIMHRLAYGYAKLRAQSQEARTFDDLKFQSRELIGYAATGIPFVVAGPTAPIAILVYNDRLDAWLPPGGHFEPAANESPTETLKSKIRKETGAEGEIVWSAPEFDTSGDVTIQPSPSFVLFENLKSMTHVSSYEAHSFHYDFNYVCTITPETVPLLGSGTQLTLQVPLRSGGRVDIRNRIVAAATRAGAADIAQNIPDDVVERLGLSHRLLKEHRERRVTSHRLWTAETEDSEPLYRRLAGARTVPVRLPPGGRRAG